MSLGKFLFMGANVKSATSTIGLGSNSQSQLDIILVESPDDGELFSPPVNGQPAIFVAGNFRFAGLVQRYQKNKDQGGEYYQVTITDPRMILSNAKVIMGGYSGATSVMNNLYNVYGYWESTGYGNSLVTEGGMPWYMVRNALVNMINTGGNAYGGPLSFMGYTYKIDLSAIPDPPVEYRIPSSSMSILDLISEICTDGGHDFFVTLEAGNVIKINTINRITAPPLGTLTSLIESAETGTTDAQKLVRSSSGVEIRNETNSVFMVGGEITVLHQTNSISTFWGIDFNNQPIIGVPATFTIVDENGAQLHQIPTDVMNLNATPVADVIGNVSYPCSEIELRIALNSRDSWETFIAAYKPSLAALIGLESPDFPNWWAEWFRRGFAQQPLPLDMANDRMGIQLTEEEITAKIDRLYNFVRSTAERFLGKMFAVSIPYLARKIDSETLNITYSHVPTQAGYLEEGSSPLGLSLQNEDEFKQTDGRFTAFVQYENLGKKFDLSRGDMKDAVLELDGYDIDGAPLYDVYAKANLDERIIFTPTPAAIIQLPFAVHEVAEADEAANLRWAVRNFANEIPLPDGNNAWINGAAIGLGVGLAVAQIVENQRPFSVIDAGIDPAIAKPSWAAIPLKSNILRYGPWVSIGAVNGNVEYVEDQTMVPWNFGSYDAMNAAALAKITNGATSTQLTESGFIERPGLPEVGIGGVLSAGGPNVSNIRISISENAGVTTTYEFITFTPRTGIFNKNTADSIRRVSTASRDLRRELRARENERLLKVEAIHGAVRGLHENLRRMQQRRTPHPILVAEPVIANDEYRIGTALMSPGEAIASVTNNFQDKALVSLNALFRAASTSDNSMMAQYASPSGGFLGYNATNLLPYRALSSTQRHVSDWLTVGSSYVGLNTTDFLDSGSGVHSLIEGSAEQRFICHNSPLILSGWGYTVDGKAVPSNDSGITHSPNFLSDSREWKCGPLDVLWDDYRGVWTSPGMAKGILNDELPAGSSTMMTVSLNISGDLSPLQLSVNNFYDTAVASGTKVIAHYDNFESKWYITSANCAG